MSTLEEKLDQLYAAEPAEFVALRKQLQGELRAAGEKPETALLGRARRPSTSMWAVNQLVRRRPELVDALLQRAEELRVAQTQPVERDAVREAIRAHRTAIGDATDAALDVLGARANDAFREEIVSVLRAASSQPEVGRELRRGRLVRAEDVSSSFPDFGDSAPAPSEPPSLRRRETTKEQADTDAAAAAAKREALRQTELELDRARQDEASAETALAAAQRRVDDLTEQLARARTELHDAGGLARRSRSETARLARLLERARAD